MFAWLSIPTAYGAHTTTTPATPRAPEGVVVFPADSPQLKQIAIEPAREVAVAGDEITAPAKIKRGTMADRIISNVSDTARRVQRFAKSGSDGLALLSDAEFTDQQLEQQCAIRGERQHTTRE